MKICPPPNPLHPPSYLSWSRRPFRQHAPRFNQPPSARAAAAPPFLYKVLLPTGWGVAAADRHGWPGMPPHPCSCNSRRGLVWAAAKDWQRVASTNTADLSFWKRFLRLGGNSHPEAERTRVPGDDGDWNLSPEWWGTQGGGWGHNEGDIVFHKQSAMGNGVVCVTAHPASTPKTKDWAAAERELQRNWQAGGRDHHLAYRIIGYEWRALRFNYVTRQSVAKVMLLSEPSDPARLLLLQQPNCLAFEYLKSMVSAGLSAVSLAGLDLLRVTAGLQKMRILCIGLGGGSLPLYLAHNLPGSTVEAVEIDGTVISAAIDAMGFPPCRSGKRFGANALDAAGGRDMEQQGNETGADAHVKQLWGGLLDRLFLYEADGVDFVCNHEESDLYDMVFVDAYDGQDSVPHELCDLKGRFLPSLKDRLHPRHGTVVVNLHSDSPAPTIQEKITGKYGPGFDPGRPQGKIVKDTCLAYRDVLLGNAQLGDEPNSPGIAFTVAVPWQQNIALVVSRGGLTQTSVAEEGSRVGSTIGFPRALRSQGRAVQQLLGSPVDFGKRVARGFQQV